MSNGLFYRLRLAQVAMGFELLTSLACGADLKSIFAQDLRGSMTFLYLVESS